MDQFICVRLVKANRLPLNLLQFDYDLTFAILLMNADGTIYARYGTRTERHDAEKDISIEGLAAALEGALDLHRLTDRSQLAGKQPRPVQYATPDDFPSLKGKYDETLDYEGKVVGSCMHCHQVRDAERDLYRVAGKPIPDPLLFPYPTLDVIGAGLDGKYAARISHVESGSVAARSGLKAGDDIVRLNGQPILSIADVQWVLHHAGPDEGLDIVVRRDGQQQAISVNLPQDWRRRTNIDWRVSTWPLRRMGTGGLVLEAMSESDRQKLKVGPQQMALAVKHVGQYGEHAAAKRAGFAKEDVVVAFDGRSDLMTESALLAYAAQNTRPGQQVEVEILRDGQRRTLRLPMQQ